MCNYSVQLFYDVGETVVVIQCVTSHEKWHRLVFYTCPSCYVLRFNGYGYGYVYVATPSI